MADFDMTGYVEVSERLAQFFEKYPDGYLTTEIVAVPSPFDQLFLAVKAYVYEEKGKGPTASGLAWEPVPGKTPYTENSELMNAETSAWGRALIAGGYASAKSGVASANEVRNRQGSGPDLKEIRQDLECPKCGSPVIDQNKLVEMMKNQGREKTPPRWACSKPEDCPGGKDKYGWGSWDEEFPDGTVIIEPLASLGAAPTEGIHFDLPEKDDSDPYLFGRGALAQLEDQLDMIQASDPEGEAKQRLGDAMKHRNFSHPLSEQQARLLVEDVRSELGIKEVDSARANRPAGEGPPPDAWTAPKKKYLDAMRDHLFGVAQGKGMDDPTALLWIQDVEKEYPEGPVKGPKQAEALVAWANER